MSHTLSSLALLRFALWLLLCVPLAGSALGLGDIHVRSAMGQKLDAEIEFSALSSIEAESLTIRLASPDNFVQSGIDYSPVLRSLRFSVEKRGDRHVIRITSDLVMSDPFLNLLIELNAAGNRTLRQYALLFDPPAIAQAPMVVNPPEIVVQNGGVRNEKAGVVTETNTAPVVEVPSKTSGPNPNTTSNANSTSTSKSTANSSSNSSSNVTQATESASAPTKSAKHTVKQGDTLAAIAAANRAEGVSINQMLMALQRENDQAFSDNNINRLKAGSVLSIPDDDVVRAIDAGKAREFMRGQNADFQRYREQLAWRSRQTRDSAAAPNAGADDAGQRGVRSSSGTVTLQSKEATAAPATQDKLKLTAPVPERLPESDKSVAAVKKERAGNQANTGGKRDQNAETLDKIASEKAVADANSRIAALEKNISDMQQLANIQSQSNAEKQAASEQPLSPQVPVPETPPISTTPISTTPISTTPVSTPPVSTPPVSTAPADKSNAVQKTPSTPAPEPAIHEDVIHALQELTQEPTSVMAGIGGLVLLILSWFGLRYGRRKHSPEEKPAEVDGVQSIFDQAGGRNIDTSNSVFHSNFVPSVSQLDTNEVDAVAEADVYIAYGRDEQAEEILQDALRLHPDRHALRVKLLEIYATRKDRQKFGTLAAELRVLTHGVGEAWIQAAQMGMVLDPGNLLYGAAVRTNSEFISASPKPVPAQPAATTSPVADFEFRLDGLLDERRNDITTSTPTAPTGGHLASARTTTPSVSASYAASDSANTLEFNLSNSFSSSMSVSNSSLSSAGLAARSASTAQNSTGLAMHEADLASLKTKFDLAIACQEIGDHEGARELLAEVAVSQHPELAERAQSLLSQLA